MKNDDNIVPYPEYPGVTLKDIRSLHGRNMKPMTDREKAKLIYMFQECEKADDEEKWEEDNAMITLEKMLA